MIVVVEVAVSTNFQRQKTPNSGLFRDSNNALPVTFRCNIHISFKHGKQYLIPQMLVIATELTIPVLN